MRVVFGEVSFLFTGDAETRTEEAMIQRGHDLRADVLQVGHHGSSTSTSEAFLEAVGPDIAVYSAAAGNQYGHPHSQVMTRLLDHGVEVFGTNVHGTVVVTTDGSTISVDTVNTGRVSAPTPTTTIPATTTTAEAAPEATTCGEGLVDINAAGFDDLQRIIHIGPDRAEQILRLRPFESVDSMDRISGIGPARLADIKSQGVACAG
ncbi:hypothetical protein BH23ACT5_BH23ACT5_21180 [soil metagenome]